MTSVLVRLAILISAVAAALLATAAPAAAHPTLVATLPEAGYSLSQSPEEIGLVFDEPVTVMKFAVEGQARGPIATTPATAAQEGRVVVRPTMPLPPGRYTVRWQITAQDGDVVDGVFGFGVGVAASATRQQAGTPGLGEIALLRWVLFTGLALALGGLTADALVRGVARPDSAPPDDQGWERSTSSPPDRPRPFLLTGCLLGLVASIGLGLHQAGGGDLLSGLSRFSPDTLLASPAGLLIAVQLIAFAAAATAALTPVDAVAAVPLAVVVIAEGQRSHLMAAAGGLGGFTLTVHLAAVALWVGGLVHVARAAWAWRAQRGRVRAVLLAYARLAIAVYAVVVATGVVAALWMLPSMAALVSTAYGWMLLAKLALVALATALALFARTRLARPAQMTRTAVLARAEAVTLVAVLAASGLLTALPPPADPARGLPYPPPMTGPTIRLGTLTGQVTTALIAGEGRLEVRLRTPESDPARDEGYTLRGTLTAPGGRHEDLRLAPCGGGCFAGPATWRTGLNAIELTITADRWRGGTARFTIPWPAQPVRDLLDRARTELAAQPWVTFTETVSSDTTRPAGFSRQMRMTGRELLGKQPYRSGQTSQPVLIARTGGQTVIAFAINAESIYVRMTLDVRGRLVREDMTTPNHQITRTFPARQ